MTDGPKVVFEGQLAGLREGGSRGGNANSAFDYTLYCKCKAADGKQVCLGPLGRFRQNESGERTAYCPHCKHITVVSDNGQVKLHMEYRLVGT